MVILCIGCVAASAQSTFTQRLQQSKGGEGKVVVSHSKAIDDLINGQNGQTTQNAQTAQNGQTTQNAQTTQRSATSQNAQTTQNGQNGQTERTTTAKTDSEKAREELRKIMEQGSDTTDTSVIDTRRKVMRGGYKVDGYRVQAFAGGNQRKDRQKAERIGNTIKASYPEEPIYVHFYSPRWICRVGNYRTYEEAHQMLMNIRKLGISGASIVRGKITVQY